MNQETSYGYDAVGNQVSVIDPKNRLSTFEYDDLNRLTKIINPLSGETTFGYDKVSNQTSLTNPNNQTIDYEYDALNRLIKMTDPLDQITEFKYDKVGNQTELIDPLLRTTQYRYDDLNRLEEIEDAANQLTTFIYDKVGNLTEVTDAEGRVTTTEYDKLYRPVTVTNALSGTTTFSYDAVGNLLTSTDAENRTTRYVYDALDRLTETTGNYIDGGPINSETNVTSGFEYDAISNLISTTDAKGRVTSFAYDALNRLVEVTNALNGLTEYQYDEVGNVVKEIDPLTTVTFNSYDDLDRLTETTANYVEGGPVTVDTNVSVSFAYDALGNLTQLTDPRAQVTRYGYDDLNRLVSMTDPLSHTVQYEYDAIGNATALIDPLNHRTEFDYDPVDRLEMVTDPLSRVTSYGYDQVGNQTQITDAEGRIIRFAYDALNRLETVTQNYVDGGPENHQTNVQTHFDYDAVGNLTDVTDPRDHTRSFTYDGLHRLKTETDALNHQTVYEYDKVGNLVEMTDAKTQVTTYEYDDLNRLTDIIRPDETVDFTYDAVGNRLTMTDPHGTTEYDYDELYRVTDVTFSGALAATVGYQYDANGNRTGLTYPDSSQVTYTYDAANRLTEVLDWDSGVSTYDYDAANRLAEMVLPNGVVASYDYDDASQLTDLTYRDALSTSLLAAYGYSYDLVGNRTQAVETIANPLILTVGTYEEVDGLVTIEGEHFTERINGVAHSWLLKSGTAGYTGTSYLQSGPGSGTRLYQTDEISQSPAATYLIDFSTVESYTVWVRGYAHSAAADSVYVGLGDQLVEVTGFAPGEWGWSRNLTQQIPITTTGVQTLSLLMRENGLLVDRILLITDTNYVPDGYGPDESPRLGEETYLTSIDNGQWPMDHSQLAHNPIGQSPFALAPTAMLLIPLVIAGPLVRRKRWQRFARALALALYLFCFGSIGLAMASADATMADQLTLEPYGRNTQYEIRNINSNTNLIPYARPDAQTAGTTTTTTYTYDPLYRLTGANDTSGQSYGYSYDAAGNRLAYWLNGTQVATYTYNAANWLTTVGSATGVTSYQYDNNGNLLDDGYASYTYDSADRLSRMTVGTSNVDYLYNGDGVRIAEIEDGLRTDFVQDVVSPLSQVLTAEQGGTTAKYLRGLGLIGEHRSGSGVLTNDRWQFFLPDALGSVRQTADLAGKVNLTRRYDPFGGVESQYGLSQTRYGFAGEEQNQEGHLFLRARTYNPATGRFLQQDKVRGTANDPRTLHRYTYAFANPVNYTDPSGLMPATGSSAGSGGGGVAAPMSGGNAVPMGVPGGGTGSVNSPGGQPGRGGGSGGHGPSLCGQSGAGGTVWDSLWGIHELITNEIDALQGFADQVKNEAQRFAKNPRGYIDHRIDQAQDWAGEQWDTARDSLNQFSKDPLGAIQRRVSQMPQNFQRQWKEVRTGVSLTLDLIPVIGDIKSVIEGLTGRDLAGNKLSPAMQTAYIAAGLLGAFTILDEIGQAGRLLNHAVNKADFAGDVVKGGKGLDRLDDAQDAGRGLRQGQLQGLNKLDSARGAQSLDNAASGNRLDQLDEFTGGSRPARSAAETREALSNNSGRGALSQRIDDRQVQSRLDNLDAFTGGNAPRTGGNIRERLTNSSSSANLSKRTKAAQAWAEAGVDTSNPAIRRAINQGRGPIRGGSGSLDDVNKFDNLFPDNPSVVIDLGSGGSVDFPLAGLSELATRYPEANVIGVDILGDPDIIDDYIKYLNSDRALDYFAPNLLSSVKQLPSNASFVWGDFSKVIVDESADLVTSFAPFPSKIDSTMDEAVRIAKPGGRVIIVTGDVSIRQPLELNRLQLHFESRIGMSGEVLLDVPRKDLGIEGHLTGSKEVTIFTGIKK